MALPGGQLHEVDACSEGGKLEFDLSINGLMELLVDFSALAIVELYLGGIAVVGGKPKSKLITESIGKGDGSEGWEDLLGKGYDTPKETLAEVGCTCRKGAGDATLSDGLMDVELPRTTRFGASHGPDALVAQRLPVGASAQSQKEDQDAEVGHFWEEDRARHLELPIMLKKTERLGHGMQQIDFGRLEDYQ